MIYIYIYVVCVCVCVFNVNWFKTWPSILVVTLASVVADARFDLPSPSMSWFGSLSVNDRVRVASLVGCDFYLDGVAGVTPRVLSQYHRPLSQYADRHVSDDDVREALLIAQLGLKYMPVHDANGVLTYSTTTRPTSLPTFLAEFALDGVTIEPIDSASHPQCLCKRIYYQQLTIGVWHQCVGCRSWLCPNCYRQHSCVTDDVRVVDRLQQFDGIVDDALRPAKPLPLVHNLPSERLVPLFVLPVLVEFSPPTMMRSFLQTLVTEMTENNNLKLVLTKNDRIGLRKNLEICRTMNCARQLQRAASTVVRAAGPRRRQCASAYVDGHSRQRCASSTLAVFRSNDTE